MQGEQLSCVIIDRLPFAVPSDPVVAARVKSIDAEGGNAFFQYQVPAAVITLKQGFGRLIRSLHDRGLLVLTRQSHPEEAVRKSIRREPAGVPQDHGFEAGGGVFRGSIAVLAVWGGRPRPPLLNWTSANLWNELSSHEKRQTKIKIKGGGRGRPPHMLGIGVK